MVQTQAWCMAQTLSEAIGSRAWGPDVHRSLRPITVSVWSCGPAESVGRQHDGHNVSTKLPSHGVIFPGVPASSAYTQDLPRWHWVHPVPRQGPARTGFTQRLPVCTKVPRRLPALKPLTGRLVTGLSCTHRYHKVPACSETPHMKPCDGFELHAPLSQGACLPAPKSQGACLH